jgi:hypothetical protein
MNMNGRNGLFDGAAQLDVEAPVDPRRKACLDAHLRGSELVSLYHATDDFVRVEKITLLRSMRARKRAKFAGFGADIREVHVAIDHVRDAVARVPPPQLIGGRRQGEKIGAVRPTQ